ncbi:CST complex subunit CTC1 [Brachionichthys hirsutus]|uniref:CST complex subunit CTC1 n=1 Tax=Brachionichthys hirsutus TaxID=412623 RepID=UPI0036045E3A
MDPQQVFLDRFKTSGEAESIWLKHIFSFVTEHVHPVASGSAGDDAFSGGAACPVQMSVCVVKAIRENSSVTHSLPVSYRPVSILELMSQQHLACVSNLSWTTNQQRVWSEEAELCLPGHRALPRVHLLLIGCLREGRSGEWRLTDASGSIRCDCVCPSPLWLDRPVFLPHWNYIPHHASGPGVELVGSPVLLCPPGGGVKLDRVAGVSEADGFLHSRTRGQRLSVCGHVASVCPLLVVAGTTFFCFSLSGDCLSVPVLVKGRQLWWSQCVCVGQRVCVTALRGCVLRGWRGNNVLCVTDGSEIHTAAHNHDPLSSGPPLLVTSHTDNETCEGGAVQSTARLKLSRVISYQGTVTEVVSEGAGLYVIDHTVGLCLAYQPTLRRSLRAGDLVELHHVHFLYRSCPDFPPTILCTCLRSSLRVTTFSKVGGGPPGMGCPSDGVLAKLLLEKSMGVSEYLWTCHLSSQLSHSLAPSVLKQQCVCVLSWKIMECVWGRGRGGRRDIYSEMLDEPHTCPLTQYSVDPRVHQYSSISALTQSLQSYCWSSMSLSSLLPSGGSSLSSAQINSALAWSCKTLSSDPQTGYGPWRRPLLLVGMLELPSQTSEHAMHLRDGTGAVHCVVTETRDEEEGGQGAAFNTAWIGCLVCVHKFTMVMERFIQSEFPSIQYLDQHKYITHKHCRVYLQFSLDHLNILSPSIAMVTHLQQQRVESCDDVTWRAHTVPEGTVEAQRGDSSPMAIHPVCGSFRPCVSMVIRVEDKEGVAWRNVGAKLREQQVGVAQCFSLRASVIGPIISWGRDPRNGPITKREADANLDKKVVLVFTGVSVRWFPLLQPRVFYRLTAVNTQDPRILIGCRDPRWSGLDRHRKSTLLLQPGWRFHTLPLPLLKYTQPLSPSVPSVSDVIDCRSEVVCFRALVSDRISLVDRTSNPGDTNSGVRLTVCDQTGRSLQVYLDLSDISYPPGMLPGNTLLLSAFQRKISRSGHVYCSNLPISSITVVSLGVASSVRPPAPMVHLGTWAGSSQQGCAVGQVRGHGVCFLFLQLQWSCSHCGGVSRQSCSSPRCRSTSSVFQSKAKMVVDDGTGEAHVWFSGVLVRHLLRLSDSRWEGLQRALRVKGHLRIYPRGHNLVSDSDDALVRFLLCLCSSDIVCRQVILTCRKLSQQRPEEVKRFSRGHRDFMTRMTPPLQLTCLDISSNATCLK